MRKNEVREVNLLFQNSFIRMIIIRICDLRKEEELIKRGEKERKRRRVYNKGKKERKREKKRTSGEENFPLTRRLREDEEKTV